MSVDNVIFYFSGTGNSQYVAQELAQQIGDCRVEAIARYDTATEITAGRIGLVFPTYYWGLPNIVKKFIAEMQVTGQAYFWVAYTFGGYSGVTPHLAKKLLLRRGWTLGAAFGFQLPQNFILSTYRVPNEKTQMREFDKANGRFPLVAETIIKKHSYFEPEPLRFRPFHFVGYRLNASVEEKLSVKDKNFMVADSCNGCGLCAKGCPVQNIEMAQSIPMFQHHCEFCLQCLHACPKEAIDYQTQTRGRERYKNPKITALV